MSSSTNYCPNKVGKSWEWSTLRGDDEFFDHWIPNDVFNRLQGGEIRQGRTHRGITHRFYATKEEAMEALHAAL